MTCVGVHVFVVHNLYFMGIKTFPKDKSILSNFTYVLYNRRSVRETSFIKYGASVLGAWLIVKVAFSKG